MRGATVLLILVLYGVLVSIHAPREGCDPEGACPLPVSIDVSIHAPREGCDETKPKSPPLRECFNSRTPGGVRPPNTLSQSIALRFQFTHPGRGATGLAGIILLAGDVSIHAPREGCDVLGSTQYDLLQEFQFTHPGRGAT